MYSLYFSNYFTGQVEILQNLNVTLSGQDVSLDADDVDGLVHDCSNSTAYALELLQSWADYNTLINLHEKT